MHDFLDNLANHQYRKDSKQSHPMWSLGWRLEKIAKDIDGTLKHYECSDRTGRYKKIVIEYDHHSKE